MSTNLAYKEYSTDIESNFYSVFNRDKNFKSNDDDINYSDYEVDDVEIEKENEKKEEKIFNEKIDYTKDDTIKMYLNEISRYKLLNADEEKQLSKKIQEENDEEALDELVNSNLRLVVKIAKQYMSKEYPFIDIIQDGNVGLITAAKKFDYKKDVRFSTYASWWIKQTIVRSLTVKKRVIRIPHRKEEKLRKINKAWNNYYQKNKKSPSMEELSVLVKLKKEEIEKILVAVNPIISFESSLNDENFSVKNTIGDESYKPEEAVIKENLANDTNKILESLYPKERMILIARYGLNSGKKWTLKKMGAYFGISAETVRQIELRALRKLRIRYSYLKDYISTQ